VSVNIIAELHPLRSSRVRLTASPKPIEEIIRELNTGFPLRQARVSRNGEIVKDFSTMAQDGDTLWIKFVPYGDTHDTGVGMKAGGWALVALGIAAFFIPGFGAPVGVALIGTGLGMVTGGAVLLNVHIPSLKDREKPEQDPSVRGGKNQARPHGRIPVLFGRHRIYPDLAANPHTEIIDGRQYFTQLFCGGYQDCVIDLDSIKLGDTPLVDLSHSGDIDQILARADPLVSMEIIQDGQPSNLYPHCVHEDMLNAALKNEIDDGDGKKISGEIVRTTPDNTDKINVDIFLYNGIGRYNNDGGIGTAKVEVEAYYKRADDDSPDYELLGFFNGQSNTISGKELKTKRYQITKSVEPGRYKVKIVRATPDSSNSKIIDEVYVGALRSKKTTQYDGQTGQYFPVRPIRPVRQKDLTIIALRVMATDKFNGVVDSLNYIATSKLPVYSPSGSGAPYWLAAAETRNPAAMLLHALRGGPAQQRVDPDDIDWASFENFYRWCGERGYTCDAYLSESVTIAELLRMIGGAARADVLRVDSKITVVQDIERPTPMQLFTPKNTKSYSVTMLQADIPDAIALRFIDEDAGYAQTELKVYHTPDGNPPEEGEPETIQKTDLWGIANSAQARRIGMYNYACLKNRPFVHTIEVDIEYLLCNKGDRIQYAGDLALTGAVQGRVAETLWSPSASRYVGIRLDEPVETEPDKQYAVRIRRSDGTIILKDVALAHAPDEIYFTEPLEPNDAPQRGDVYAFGIRGQEVVDLVITDIQPQADLSAVLTCVEYSPAIFDVDDDNFILPEFENKITPVSGAIDSGVVGTARWRLFVTYHDSEREPPRPGGDGQGGGWHYAHTSPSLWQSSKTAESVDSGEWGPPVRIKGERGNTDTVAIYLSLSPQTKILKRDSDGNLLAGSLPFTAWAELYKWNYKIPPADGSPRYPGGGGKIVDPVPGGMFPAAGRGVAFSLVDAPQGVAINAVGRITVAADAALGDGRRITVQAEYKGEVYTAELVIQIEKRVGDARYLGTIDTLPQGNAVTILKGRNMGQVAAVQGDYVFAVASGQVGPRVWRMGYVYQWAGAAWEERDPVKYTDLYTLCLKDGLDVPELTQEMGWFGAVFAARIVAQQAFIEKLAAQVITLQEGGLIQSENFRADQSGFRIKHDGDAEFNEVTIRATGTFNNGRFSGIEADGMQISGNSSFSGDIDSGVLKVLPSSPVSFSLANPSPQQISTFMDNVRNTLGYPSNIANFTLFPTTGTITYYYDGYITKTIKSMQFVFSGYMTSKHLIITPTSGSNVSSSHDIVDLSFTVGTSARTVRLVNLPTSTNTQHEVFRISDGNGNYDLKIKG
jgi:hypothetical protein